MAQNKQLKPKYKRPSKLVIRKYLNMDAMLSSLHQGFCAIACPRTSRAEISLADALMSGFAMFSLKDPSLLAFDERRNEDEDNLRHVYSIENVPSDTQMRTILDPVKPEALRPLFKDVFRKLQRGKALEPFVYFDGCYLLSIDGTGSFSSSKLRSASCLVKKHKSGKITYHQQVLGAAIVHPDLKEVIPLAPEMILRQDGSTKNDCERNAAKRFLFKLRQDHPKLPLIVIEDGLSSNEPHIRVLQQCKIHYILGAKPGDHPLLFHCLDEATKMATISQCSIVDPNDPLIHHEFRFLNNVPLNKSNQDLLVNVIDYWQRGGTKKDMHFSWVTDFTITVDNVYQLMRGGRARWKIENETFNTLKNQGYHFEHNFGLGKKHLSEVFVNLMMLAFLVDQTQQLTNTLFQSVWRKFKTKRSLWEHVRTVFFSYELDSMDMLYTALLNGYRKPKMEKFIEDP